MHFSIPRLVSGLGAGRVGHYNPAGCAASGIEMDRATLQPKSAVDRVQRRAQREFDLGLCWIKLNRDLLRVES